MVMSPDVDLSGAVNASVDGITSETGPHEAVPGANEQDRGAAAAAAASAVLIGVVLYALIDTALLFLRPQFSILHNAESDYGSSGSWAWLMDLNFLLRGLLSLAAVRAISLATPDAHKSGRFRLGQALLSLWAVSSALLAFFPDDPVGTPTRWQSYVHLVLAFIAFFAVVVGAILVAQTLRALPGWQPVRVPVAVLPWVALIPLLLLGRTHFRPHSLGGLYEKIFLAIELVWLFALPIARGSD